MRIKIPLFKCGCLMPLIVMVISACSATVISSDSIGNKTEAKIPFGFVYDDQRKVIESDVRVINATTKAIQELADNPELIKHLTDKAVEAQQTNQ